MDESAATEPELTRTGKIKKEPLGLVPKLEPEDETPQRNPVKCESINADGTPCLMDTWYFASYSEGDAFPLCIGHLILGLEEVRVDPVHQQQEWVITYA